MKKFVSLILVTSLLITSCGCKNVFKLENVSSEVTVTETAEPIILTNKMTETERSKVSKHELTLLDEPEETTGSEPSEHKVQIAFHTISLEEMKKSLEEHKDELSEEEFKQSSEFMEEIEKSGKDGYDYPFLFIVDGKDVQHYIPYSAPDYDGGYFKYTEVITAEEGEPVVEDNEFENIDEYIEYIRKVDKDKGYSDAQTEQDILHFRLAADALKTGEYEKLDEEAARDIFNNDFLYSSVSENGFYRKEWEYDREAVEAIKDYVDEIDIYDEELCRDFVVHVTLPPEYDANRSYPVFFLTDGIWRFGNVPELRKLMENGEAAPVILVSLWYSYNFPYEGGVMRYDDLVLRKQQMLEFVTDNLMPYLGENYNIDYANSTLYGHSDGGVFTHYALFKSDEYENQPFGRYIIGSPAFWGINKDDNYENVTINRDLKDYGYFMRNEKLDKKVFLCGGSQEDPDYADRYNGQDSTLQGLEKLKDRLEEHGADYKYELYDSHHYQYIPQMLSDYLKSEYPN